MNEVLVLAPLGRDASLIEQSVARDGVQCRAVATIDALCAALDDDPGAAIIFEEALPETHLAQLVDHLALQPPWSDFPLIILTVSGVSQAMSRIYERLSHSSYVTLIQRPLHPLTLNTAVQVALRARGRQFELRDQLHYLHLQEQAVSRANTALEVSNRDLQQFVYAASHDLKEPLRMIKSYAQLTKKRYADKLDTAGKEFLDFMVDGATRMHALLEDLLKYSRASNFDNIARQFVDCNSVLSKTLANLEMALQEGGASIESEVLPVVSAHETHMIQLFQNLISNAIRYRSARPLEIHIKAVRQDNNWLFSVADNGIGIDPKFKDQIFLLFRRLHGVEYSGTGIGLALCQRVVQHYGGRIWVESEVDRGATFYFTLPVAETPIGA